MAVGQPEFPYMSAVSGIKLGTACAGIKQQVRDDLLIIEMVEHSSCAAVFTQNAFCAAPVQIAKDHLGQAPRWLLINSGNANAGTGMQGLDDALQTCMDLAECVNASATQVLPFSTGVIGQSLPVDKIKHAIPKALGDLNQAHWSKAAAAIMTTDTFAKGCSVVINIDDQPITITGIAKGAGMIQPNMATMLSFIATDARIDNGLLQQCLSRSVALSFNCISVDGDTSTNDACVLIATGCSKAPEITEDSDHYRVFADAVLGVCKSLAEAIVRDGEGATKLMRIIVEQALTDKEAHQVGKTIAHSPLVKTAFFASDPNWGRILAAVGRAGVENMVLADVQLFLDDVCIVRNGGRADDYTEEAGQRVMNQAEITITVKLGRGSACQEILTCDLSYDYVKINAEYRT